MASRWAVAAVTVPLLVLAGCTGTAPYDGATKTPATYDLPEPVPYVPAGSAGLPAIPILTLPGTDIERPASASAPPPSEVGPPRLYPGTQFLFETVTEATEDVRLGQLPVRTNFTHGLRVLSADKVLEGRPVVLAAKLGHFGSGLVVTGATTLDLGTMARRSLADLNWLRECQEKPETCPPDLKAGVPANETERPKVPFPLKAGKTWTDGALLGESVGTWSCRVDAINTTMLLGELDTAVFLACDAAFPMDEEEGSRFQTGGATLRWRAIYSKALSTFVVETRSTEMRLHIEDLEGVRDIASATNRTVRLIDVVLAAEPEPDWVELYDLLELRGRSLRTSFLPKGDYRYTATVTTTEIPNSTISWHLRDGQAKIWQQGTGKRFNLTLEPGSYILRVEAVHKGKVLAFHERALLRHLFADGEKQCDDLTVDLAGAAKHGSCPVHQFELRGEVSWLYVWFWGRGNSAPGMAAGEVVLKDPRNVTVGTRAWGYQDFWVEPEEAAGVWTLEPRPKAVQDASYRYEVIAIYDPLKPAVPST